MPKEAGGRPASGAQAGFGGGSTVSNSFTLRYATPAEANCGSGTTCAVSLTGKAISAGDLLAYSCAIYATGNFNISIASVSNTGTYIPDQAGTVSVTSGGTIAEGHILAAAAESGTDTITFTGSIGGSSCLIWDASYTGSPAYDGANAFAKTASSTTLALPTLLLAPVHLATSLLLHRSPLILRRRASTIPLRSRSARMLRGPIGTVSRQP